MTERVTKDKLNKLTDYLNKITNNPSKPWVDGKAQAGCYHISYAYGGARLEQMCTSGGCSGDPLKLTRVSKGQLFELIHAFIKGIELSQGAAQ